MDKDPLFPGGLVDVNQREKLLIKSDADIGEDVIRPEGLNIAISSNLRTRSDYSLLNTIEKRVIFGLGKGLEAPCIIIGRKTSGILSST